jgi:serine phosphatase RsbU (regulator of sigma subunit)
VALAVGDVVGHDITAAGAMGQLRASLRMLALDDNLEPGTVLERLGAANAIVHMTAFATAVFARLTRHGDDWDLHWASAGHPPPVLIERDGRTATLNHARGMALVPNVIGRYPSARVRLEPGCTVLLYTDGLIERRGIDLEHSIADLAARAAAHLDTSATLAEVCDRLSRAALGNDDLALLAVRVRHHP